MRYIYFQVYVKKLNSREVVLPFEPHTGDTNELLNVDVVNVLGFYIKKINEFSEGGIRMFLQILFHLFPLKRNTRSKRIRIRRDTRK
jgi:hypothetical protein